MELLVQLLLLVLLKIELLWPYCGSFRELMLLLMLWLSWGGAVQYGLVVRRDLFIGHLLHLGIKANFLDVHRVLVHVGHVGITVAAAEKLLLRLLV